MVVVSAASKQMHAKREMIKFLVLMCCGDCTALLRLVYGLCCVFDCVPLNGGS